MNFIKRFFVNLFSKKKKKEPKTKKEPKRVNFVYSHFHRDY